MAGTKISALPVIAAPALTDQFAVVQAGVTYRETITQLQSVLGLSSVSISGLQNQQYTYITDTGAADAYVGTMVPAVTAYVAGQSFSLLIQNNNTGGAVTLNINGLGTKSVLMADGSVPLANAILMGQVATFVYDGTNFQYANPFVVPMGDYAETIVLTGAAVPLTTTVAADVASLALGVGEWDVFGNISFKPAAGTTTEDVAGSISLVSNTMATAGNASFFNVVSLNLTAGSACTFALNTSPLVLAAPTTIYLVARASFSVSTMGAFGFVGARRAR